MDSSMTSVEAAARSIEDSYFAQKVMCGEEDFPEVRDAILADLYESTSMNEDHTEEEALALFKDRFQDERPIQGHRPMACFVKYYPKGPKPKLWEEWLELPKPNLRQLSQADS